LRCSSIGAAFGGLDPGASVPSNKETLLLLISASAAAPVQRQLAAGIRFPLPRAQEMSDR
jgi:hypothetical protein